MWLLRLLFLSTFAFLCCDARASLCAEVVDPTESILHGVAINVSSLTDLGVHFSGLTGNDGNVCFDQLPEGLYAVEASLEGFLNVRYYPIRISYPQNLRYTFRLPLGEIREGGVQPDAILSGTLGDPERPSSGVMICLFREGILVPVACGVTNDLGQYALEVRPGTYRIDLSKALKLIYSTTIDLSHPGFYRNRVLAPKK